MQRILDSMIGTPALVLNVRLDIVTANALGYALFSPVYADPVRPANNARFVFLDPHATEFFRDWDKAANDTVALLRAAAGRNAYDRRLSDLIGELSTRSDDFRRRWAAHDVQIHTTGIKLIHHPVVGDLDLPYESFPLSHHLTQSLLTYTAEPGSPSQDALNSAGQLGRQRHAPQQRERAREHLTRAALLGRSPLAWEIRAVQIGVIDAAKGAREDPDTILRIGERIGFATVVACRRCRQLGRHHLARRHQQAPKGRLRLVTLLVGVGTQPRRFGPSGCHLRGLEERR